MCVVVVVGGGGGWCGDLDQRMQIKSDDQLVVYWLAITRGRISGYMGLDTR